ncbi:GNAT family N-acetyltransferase [Aureimonas frigidaquae]|uniref:GNAT family N-acetyltransferase n=1 Tax=Aureimonas frigidaquae TaxID=424757 RepID=UPI0009F9B8DD|nr:GNAT family N-acetyltransferase [Aureimonas frigidaquae]
MYWYLPWNWSLAFLEGLSGQGRGYVATPLGDEADLRAAASIHAESFAHAWDEDEFTSLLSQAGTFGFVARRPGHPLPDGLVLARLTVDEAEILTVAVSRHARNRGIGRLLMDRVLEHLHAERALALFLEVDETNQPALALYRKLRFEEVGRRPAYYPGPDGQRTSALVLKRSLRG